MLIYHRIAAISGVLVADASMAPGFLTEDEVVARYAEMTGRDLAGFGFHLGLAAYKLAAILEGIHYRHLRGQTVGSGFEGLGEVTEALLGAGLTYLKEH
jgi:aminoglycoside phosphotransferase (APT) family kinase protein